MEVLSNIGNMLITENEQLTNILLTPSTFLEAWLDFLLFTSILKIHFNKKQVFIFVVTFSITSVITKIFIPEPINVFINYLIMFSLIKTMLKQSILKTILCTIIPTIIFALVSTLILHPFLRFFGLTYEQNLAIPIYQFIYLITLYLVIIIILLLIKVKNLKINFLDEIAGTNQKIIILNLIAGFFILCIQAILTIYYLNIVPIIITLLNFIALFVFFAISFYSLNRTMKLQVTTTELETAENYNKSLSILYDEVKAFKHDFNNMVYIIGGYVNNNDLEGLKKYYKDLEKDCQRVNNVEILNPNAINNPGVYNLLMAKYNKAEKENVKINLELLFDFTKLNMHIYEFTRILGILLDNAIEAASKSQEKEINISIRDSISNRCQIICIENSYSNKNVDTTKIFEKGVTEKTEHMGMGLWEVKQIENRNNNIKLITTNDEKYFKQQLEINY